jgi:ankyrin repeat protein
MHQKQQRLDKQYLLNVPLAFILQTKTIQDVEQYYDDNGWNILHHAVAEANINKVKELLHFNFNICLNSRKNFISNDIYFVNEKKKQEKFIFLNKIPFSHEGFTPVHLAYFLFNYYTNLSEDFFYKGIAEKYQSILSLFTNATGFKRAIDGAGNTLFDSAFLLENITLIDLTHMVDNEFITLNTVKSETALKILHVMNLKFNDGSHQHLVDLINQKILKEKLGNELSHKEGYLDKTTSKKI